MTETPVDRAHWARVAAQWTAWARAPGHDAFWAYRDALLAFIGRGEARALEVGCGEGRVSRTLKELGYHVTATDAVAELVDAAAAARSADRYAVAPAASLPFEDGSFDLIVAYNVLMDVEDVPAALVEISRVLAPGGEVVISLVHPFCDRGRFAGPEPDAPFVVEGSYFGRERFEGSEERGGLTMEFAGWSQPLEAYAEALTRAGLAITGLREPVPQVTADDDSRQKWTRLPLFLWLKARRLA
ncbi:class I SAM-dependent methyltransferase [Phreatobacter stygius]|uniref:Class I SAM-dependent methyltransferase n=1 Tax=Phreatobacter stygius TaxID=1940610 RepID=A0A4D7BDF7_9HYPH|nr:class I SAM-dependent methyltransferase [Phreatobacter stygius]QCI67396.1 class I SAM-dependent methyltransferase [Phreatobacter stygius]